MSVLSRTLSVSFPVSSPPLNLSPFVGRSYMCTSHTRCTTYAFGVACTRRYDVRTQVQGLGDRRRTVHRGSTRGRPNVDRSVSNGRCAGGRCVDIGRGAPGT